jgi:hypothetical protein
MTRLGVGFIHEPLRVVDRFGGPVGVDIGVFWVASGAGADMGGGFVVSLDPLRRHV